ncbi:hypothetical protein CRUP_020753 [Coryphaenoides rupestris]|nr:hypothetical protein CRUP_020753 [Coryphaenoides rupestris]
MWSTSIGPQMMPPLKSKMIYASSKEAIKKKIHRPAPSNDRIHFKMSLFFASLCPPFSGIKHEVQANCLEEVRDRRTLAEKLGGSSIVTLEGRPL